MVDLQVDQHGIARIKFGSAQHNSLAINDLSTLKNTLLDCGKLSEVGVILLSSQGDGTFCAGANFNELISLQSLDESKSFFSGFGQVILAMRDCGKIVVGRVQGKAVGGGVGLAAACDYVIAHSSASVRLSELNIGLGPFVIGPMVTRKIGLSGFSSLSLNPRHWKDAHWALTKGLYNDVYDTQTECDEKIESLVQDLAGLSSEAKESVKKMCWEGTHDWASLMDERAEISGRLLLTAECQAQIQSFLSKSK